MKPLISSVSSTLGGHKKCLFKQDKGATFWLTPWAPAGLLFKSGGENDDKSKTRT